MAAITSKNDFIGFYCIAQSEWTELPNFIDQFENSFLNDLLGCELADALRTDLTGDPLAPQNARFTAIWNAFCENDDCNEKYESFGIRDMLLGFIFDKYVPEQDIQNTSTGNRTNKNGNNEVLTESKSFGSIERRYNRAIESYKAIQWYICKNSSDYPEYKGVIKDYSFTSWGV